MNRFNNGLISLVNSWPAGRLAMAYVFLAIGWILLVEWMVFAQALPESLSDFMPAIRNLILVGISAAIIFLLSRRRHEVHSQAVGHIQDKYKVLFDSNPIAMWIYDVREYRFLMVNHAAVVRYGYSEQEFRRMTLFDIRPEDDWDLLRENLTQQQKADYLFSGVWRHVKKNGEIIYVEIDSHVIRYEGQDCRLVLATDVSQLIQSQQEIKAIAGELSNFVYRASHDLRGPIARIIGLSMMMEKDQVHSGDYLRILHSTALLMDRMLARLLSINSLKDYDPQVKPIILNKMVNEVVGQVLEMNRSTVQVENQIADHLLVHADPKILAVVLENLLDNSIKYRNPAGENRVWIKATQEGGYISIQVIDNGIGINDKVRSQIFNLFFRGTEKSNGSGLGLYIVQEALKRHRGSIRFHSDPGCRTVFEVSIPELR